MVHFSQSESISQETKSGSASYERTWSLPTDTTDRETFYKTKRIHTIKKPLKNLNDYVAKFKRSKVGKFYYNHLKQHAFIRLLVRKLWSISYPIYANYILPSFRNREARRWRKIITLHSFINNNKIIAVQLLSEAKVKTPPPFVYPISDQHYLDSPHENFYFPPVYTAEVKQGMVYGGTNLVLADDYVICHDLYDFKRDYTSEELHGRILINPNKNMVRWLFHDKEPEHLASAAVFVDACATNYAHWLTEVLPRIAAFCSNNNFKNIPLIVNDGLHKNIMESLFRVTGIEREIFTIPIGRAVEVDSLFITSVAGYVPFERRNNKLGNHSHGLFSPKAFRLVSERIKIFEPKNVDNLWPEKIYLRRNSEVRSLVNCEVIEKFIVSIGYAIIEPETLTFLQQVKLFSHAKMIIGSSGAALANIVFAQPDTKILIFIGQYPNTSYWYWQNIACASQKTITYALGAISSSSDGIHANFSVNINNIPKEFCA